MATTRSKPTSATNTGRICWYSGAVIRMCLCGGPQIPVITNGKDEWAYCPLCNKTWNVKTFKEIHVLELRPSALAD